MVKNTKNLKEKFQIQTTKQDCKKFAVYQVSHIGNRKNNEDRVGFCFNNDVSIFVLADGMGGHEDGEIAAQMALQVITKKFQEYAQPFLNDVNEFLKLALLEAHMQISDYATKLGRKEAPRTTLVVLLIQNDNAFWIHCGDSRLYWIRNGKVLTRTKDHSYYELQKTKPEYKNISRNVLYTCLGSSFLPIFDLSGPNYLEAGDKFLLCSDGLWNSLNTPIILKELVASSLSKATVNLVQAALMLADGKSDNVSVLTIDWKANNKINEILDFFKYIKEKKDEKQFFTNITDD